MKKILINTIILGTIQLFPQDISCVEFVSMSNKEANQFMTKFKKDIQVISDDNSRKDKTKYLNKNYQKTKHRYKCILFRNAKTSSVEDFKRVKALAKLDKETLNSSEKRLYHSLVLENQKHLSSISRASLVKNSVCNYPLLYLSSQSTTKGLLIYEKRVVNGKIETFSNYINPQKIQMQCGTTVAVQNSYLKYLNNKGASIPLIISQNSVSTNIYNRLQKPKERINIDEIIKSTFVVTKKFKAVNYQSGKRRTFKVGEKVLFEDLEAKNGDKLFEYQGKTFRVALYTWKSSLRERK